METKNRSNIDSYIQNRTKVKTKLRFQAVMCTCIFMTCTCMHIQLASDGQGHFRRLGAGLTANVRQAPVASGSAPPRDLAVLARETWNKRMRCLPGPALQDCQASPSPARLGQRPAAAHFGGCRRREHSGPIAQIDPDKSTRIWMIQTGENLK